MPNIHDLSKFANIAEVAAGATSAGTEVVSSAIDMAGYDGVLIFARIATANAGNYLQAYQDSASDLGTKQTLGGSKVVATGDNEVVFLNIYRPTKRYVAGSIIRAGAATATGDMYALKYRGRLDEANSTAGVIVGKSLISPAEGTA